MLSFVTRPIYYVALCLAYSINKRYTVRGTMKTICETAYRNKVKKMSAFDFKFFQGDKVYIQAALSLKSTSYTLTFKQIFVIFFLPCA